MQKKKQWNMLIMVGILVLCVGIFNNFSISNKSRHLDI